MVPFRLAVLILLILSAPAAAQRGATVLWDANVRVCPGGTDAVPPDFADRDCSSIPFYDLDPQGREIWAEARIDLDPSDFPVHRPIGLFVTGKASSAVWLNGVPLGENGHPAATAAEEVPGQMDAVFFVPRERMRDGENVVILRLSSMHGYLRLANPMHFIAVGPYASPRHIGLTIYWPALVTFGIFLIGAVYFAITALRGEDRAGSGIVALASLFVALQLLSETARGLFAYTYPVQDLRLLAILVFACAFALSLFAYLARRLLDWPMRRCLTACAGLGLLMAAIGIIEPGFDGKTLLSLLAAVGAGLVVTLIALRERRSGALPALAVLLLLAVAILLLGAEFLDFAFYLFAGAVLAWLFYRQALAIVAERRLRRSEEKRADRLEFALAKVRAAAAPERLELTTAGRTDFVAADRIIRFSGAGDYVEAHFEDGATELYDDTLARLETVLPADFVRVHRSHIVNTAYARALEKDGTGTGTLTLADGSTAPVSRRIMPSIKNALGAGVHV